MNVKCILPVVTLLFGGFFTGIYAAGTGIKSDPFQMYISQGNEAILQCSYESKSLKWNKCDNNYECEEIIANMNITTNNTKYKTSYNPSTKLYYILHVLNAQPSDEFIYRCRHNTSSTYYIQLNLYVKPANVYFDGLTGNKLEGTEGIDLVISCIADGGKPPPNMSILNGTVVNETQKVSYTIPMISRDYHMKSIECKAASAALDTPLTKTVQIYLNLKPLTPIFILNNARPEETVPLIVSCKSFGSRPAANFTWTIGGNDVTSSSTTSPPVIISNGTNTVTSTLTSSVDRNNDKQSIICKASNTAGFASASKLLDVKYAPNITVTSPTQNDAIRTVTCNPSGNPDNYTYLRWQHKSKYGEIIREFDGNKTLMLPNVSEIFKYQDSGEYVCTASNGIKDRDNKFEQTGSAYDTVNAEPGFTSDTINMVKQFGEINKAVDIYVNVYSVPIFNSFIWTRAGKPTTTQNIAKFVSSSSPTIVKDKINGKVVQLDGYNVTLTVHGLKSEDVTNDTVTLGNEFGEVMHTIMLESASVPETPGNFTRIASSTTSITVQWDPNSGGGYKQTFYIQYRVQGLLDWTTVSGGEENLNKPKRRTYEVRSLQEGQTYELKMYAENTAGKRSNVTDVLIAFTDDAGTGPSVGAIVGGIAGCLIAIIIVLLVIVYFQKKRKENGTPSTKLRASSESEEEERLSLHIRMKFLIPRETSSFHNAKQDVYIITLVTCKQWYYTTQGN